MKLILLQQTIEIEARLSRILEITPIRPKLQRLRELLHKYPYSEAELDESGSKDVAEPFTNDGNETTRGGVYGLDHLR